MSQLWILSKHDTTCACGQAIATGKQAKLDTDTNTYIGCDVCQSDAPRFQGPVVYTAAPLPSKRETAIARIVSGLDEFLKCNGVAESSRKAKADSILAGIMRAIAE